MSTSLPEGQHPKWRLLYHGTNQSSLDAICQLGFDQCIPGLGNNTEHGQGIYFSSSAKHAAQFSDTGHVVVAYVLVGDYVTGQPSDSRPPAKDPNNPAVLSDSCVDNIDSPSMFIIFQSDQVYPRFIVHFQKHSHNQDTKRVQPSVQLLTSAAKSDVDSVKVTTVKSVQSCKVVITHGSESDTDSEKCETEGSEGYVSDSNVCDTDMFKQNDQAGEGCDKDTFENNDEVDGNSDVEGESSTEEDISDDDEDDIIVTINTLTSLCI